MASIKGYELKNVKTFQGLEWTGVQGNIYYKGKKVEGIKAIVFDRSEGVVDKNYFVFSDIRGYKAIGEEYEKPVIIEDGIRTGWNMPVSAEEKGQIAGAILDYVEMFASPDMAPQM